MNIFKKSLVAVVLASAGAAAQAEVSGSAGIASMYLWRGFSLSYATPAVSGSLDYSHDSGFYAGIWGSSGDTTLGTEYDLYAGYAFEVGGVGIDVSYWDYNYPTSLGASDAEDFGLGFSYGDFSFTALIGLDEIEDQEYYVAGYSMGDFSYALGYLELPDGTSGMHLDVTYSYTDNLSFTLSGSSDDGAGYSEEALFVVAYSIPLEM